MGYLVILDKKNPDKTRYPPPIACSVFVVLGLRLVAKPGWVDGEVDAVGAYSTVLSAGFFSLVAVLASPNALRSPTILGNLPMKNDSGMRANSQTS